MMEQRKGNSLSELLKIRPLRTILILIITAAAVAAWWIVTPDIGHAVVVQETQTTQTVPKADVPKAPEVDDKSCPVNDPCERTKANWGSPSRMATRFKNGNLGNARGYNLPASVKTMFTKKWNEDHGVPAKYSGGKIDCSNHWWCGPLDVGECVVSYFLCAGDVVGWDQSQKVVLKCGGTAGIIAGGGVWAGANGAFAAAGIGGSACVYQQLGSYWGWW